MKNTKLISLIASFAITVTSAYALAPMSGELSFSGSLYFLDESASGDIQISDGQETRSYIKTTDIDAADAMSFRTILDWNPQASFINMAIPGFYGPDDDAIVSGASEDFAELNGKNAKFNDFAFNPGLFPEIVNPLWEIQGSHADPFKFIMSDVEKIVTGTSVTFNGEGAITGGGYDSVEGTWTLTTQTTANSSGGNFDFTFSAKSATVNAINTSGSAVPEPSTYAMFGTAFAILGFVSYRKRRIA